MSCGGTVEVGPRAISQTPQHAGKTPEPGPLSVDSWHSDWEIESCQYRSDWHLLAQAGEKRICPPYWYRSGHLVRAIRRQLRGGEPSLASTCAPITMDDQLQLHGVSSVSHGQSHLLGEAISGNIGSLIPTFRIVFARRNCYRYAGSLQFCPSLNSLGTRSFPHILHPARFGYAEK